ncbi:MAG: nucleotide exchange factor GrpE [Pseudonocardia sp.]
MTKHNDEQPERVVVRDRRRIDPLTGQVRTPTGGDTPAGAGRADTPGAAGSPDDKEVGDNTVDADFSELAIDPAEQKLAELSAQLDERTADLQRVSAEYANYRRRVDRDRELVAVNARAQVAAQLLTVLDDVDRAAAHGDLTGAFKAVADKLVNVAKGVGLEPFGAEGEPFDPAVHEAVQHTTSADVDGPTVSIVMRQGYRIGERVLRPAMVAVTDRDAEAPEESGASDTADDN